MIFWTSFGDLTGFFTSFTSSAECGSVPLASSAASAAGAAIDHMRNWHLASDGKIVSMAIPADGSYGIEPGIIYSYPVICKDGGYEIVQGLEVNDFSRERMTATENELREERAAVEDLFA